MPLVQIGLRFIIKSRWRDAKFLTVVNSVEDIIEGPDVIIVGTISDNKSKGIGQLKKLKMKFHSSKILVFSHLEENVYEVSYLRSGAAGYLSRSAGEDKIIRAIEVLLTGKHVFCSDKLLDRFFDDFFSAGLRYKIKKKIETGMIEGEPENERLIQKNIVNSNEKQ